MNDRALRVDLSVGAIPDSAALPALVRRAERLGYHGVLVADALWLPAPFTVLAAAAAVSETLRLGTCVLAVPLRPAAEVVQQTETLDLLSGGRFRLGLGTGAPHVAADGDLLGRPFGSGARRRSQLLEVLRAVRERFSLGGRSCPPILVAGVGPRLLELAAEHADAVALPVPHAYGVDVLGAKAEELRTIAGDRFDRLEVSSNLLATGDGPLPKWVPAHFRDLPVDSHSRLRGTPRQMADELRRRRDRYGISRVTVPQWSMEAFAPTLTLLADE